MFNPEIHFESIRNKQRIVIIGNKDTQEIFRLIQQLLTFAHKKHDVIISGKDPMFTDAPVVLIEGSDQKNPKTGAAKFLDYKHHIALLHHMEDGFPADYSSMEEYFAQYEKIAIATPKGGSILYNKEDALATIIGGQEREDVRIIEYSELKTKTEKNQVILETGKKLTPPYKNFLKHAAAARELLKRLSVTDEQFFDGLYASIGAV